MAYSMYQIVRDLNNQPSEYVSTPGTRIMAAVIVEAIHDYLCWGYARSGIHGVTRVKSENYSTARSFLFHTPEPFNSMCEIVDMDPDTLRQAIYTLRKDPVKGLALLHALREEQEALEKDMPEEEGDYDEQD